MEKLHVQPTELDMLPFYEYEYTLEIYNDIVKERNDEEKRSSSSYEDKYKPNSMQKTAQKQMSSYKMPSMPSISMPKF
jgi:hypothetical protein